ncbi:hypothetical protein U1Q18_048307 [Sarracenia purpurea var. burkii]
MGCGFCSLVFLCCEQKSLPPEPSLGDLPEGCVASVLGKRYTGGEWNYHPANGTVDIAYRYAGLDSSAWVARRGTIHALAWNGFINWRFEIGGLRMKKKNSSLMEGFIRLFQSETVHS